MGDLIDRRARVWAVVALIAGSGLLLGIELYEETDATARDLLLERVDILPIVLTSVGVVLLFRVSSRQREEHIEVIHDLELARAQGQCCRAGARTYSERPRRGDREINPRAGSSRMRSARWPCC